MTIKTPETHPNHQVVGRFFKASLLNEAGDNAVFYCDSYDSSIGYWMTQLSDPENRRNVSERAIGATYHTIWDDQFCLWGRLPPEEVQQIEDFRKTLQK